MVEVQLPNHKAICNLQSLGLKLSKLMHLKMSSSKISILRNNQHICQVILH